MKDAVIYKEYPPRHILMREYIRHFWILKSNSKISLNHTILPCTNIDFVLNLSRKVILHKHCNSFTPEGFFCTGVQENFLIQTEDDFIHKIGISFKPAGAYYFLNIPLSAFHNQIIELDCFLPHFTEKVLDKLKGQPAMADTCEMLEQVLAGYFNSNKPYSGKVMQIIYKFLSENPADIHNFCSYYGVHPRTLERIFKQYMGVSPRSCRKLRRFQKSVWHLTRDNYTDLTSLGSNTGYYDQSHFIRDFRSFTGVHPSQFNREKCSMKHFLHSLNDSH